MANRNNIRRPVLAATIFASLLLSFLLAFSRPQLELRAQGVAPARQAPAAEETPAGPQRRERAALVLATSPSARELARRIDRAIDESDAASARWGVFVTSLRDGRVLYAREADRNFAPASNMKLYTTAVALDLLGADYRWRTSVLADGAPDASGTIRGDLTLYGRGAPDLSSREQKDDRPAALEQLADELYGRGVRQVRGDIIGDESYLRGEPLGDGWLWNDVQWYFGAEVSALTINGNQLSVAVTPNKSAGEAAAVRLTPATDYVQLQNDTGTVERGRPATIGITRGLSDNELRVWGDFPAGGGSVTARLSIHRPALWAALLFRDALKARGISVEGQTRAVDARESNRTARVDPEHAVELAFVTSRPLGELVRLTNKESINLNAELILRTLGRERRASLPDADEPQRRNRADDQAGLALIRLWLERAGISTETLSLHDGSGLSRLDLVTPEATAGMLVAMSKVSSAGVFRDSLPVAGRDGTLKYRLRSEAAGRILAKTGTLSQINSLSGYATTADDEPLAFSIICNEATGDAAGTRTIDAIAALLALYRETER
ncbi:MAG TPA: D-alanyl-D-alanine carboxypeptidase/D-alanyl-D-alanine-endopeptidase [Pyrinomonadaceae bacterium]|jgi:D-alanyl-D-alanine carboxypeptidase/D-alanyl-D-alanine-endopeptidase (penicillin-binding protein 4)